MNLFIILELYPNHQPSKSNPLVMEGNSPPNFHMEGMLMVSEKIMIMLDECFDDHASI